MVTFRKASKLEAKLRMSLEGPSGSGKTYSAIQLAILLAPNGKVAVIDTERGSAAKYADTFDFDTLELTTFHPEKYIEAIHAAEEAGYTVLVIDSLSHAWFGKDGALELVDRETARQKTPNSYTAWRGVTPIQNKLVDTILQANLHIIATMRSKMDYVQTQDEKGKTIIKKVGMQPIQREGMSYEFDIVGELDLENTLIISKTRCSALAGGVFPKPGAEVADILKAWLSGAPAPTLPQPQESDKITRQDLIQLNKLRETLGLDKETLQIEASRRFGPINPANLTRDQLIELRTWLSETARAKVEEKSND